MNKDMCIIGYGMVGKATALTFGIDKYYSRTNSTITLEEAAKYKYIFICLPTPVKNGKYFTDDIIKTIQEIFNKRFKASLSSPDPIFIIRSTVYPGFNQDLQDQFGIKNIVSNPEFLSEDSWEKDSTQPLIVVIGGDDEKSREKVAGLYQGRFKYNKPIITDSATAELLKLTFNAFFATKVVFANAIYDIAQKSGANYETIKNALLSHPWGSKNHFTIFDKGGRGAGGKCLRKDLQAITYFSNKPFFIHLNNENEILLKESNKI